MNGSLAFIAASREVKAEKMKGLILRFVCEGIHHKSDRATLIVVRLWIIVILLWLRRATVVILGLRVYD